MRPMAASPEWRCSVADLPPGRTVKFRLACGERSLDGFVVSHDGGYYAYVNRCAHVGTPLDLWPNEFLSQDGRALVCATHGAIYEPASGRCTAGPCVGAALTALPLRREGGEIVVACPGP
ncbi:MAG: Rieske (2Fe-2S) protein [Candidatus Rokuibacteriota bacterium]